MQRSPSSEPHQIGPSRPAPGVLLVITDQDTDTGMDRVTDTDTDSGSVILRPLFSGRIG
jgi:hypothetical protein